MNKDYYKTLEVEKSASDAEIKKAYRKLALKYHPDKGGGSEAEKKFKEVNEAYQTLSDPQKRTQYDQFGNAGAQGFGGFGQGQGGFSQGDFSGFSQGGFGGLGDIFEDFFGQAFSSVTAEVAISPAQAVLGDKIKINVAGENIDLEIPAGVQNGTTFRFPGKGRAYKGGKKGDLNLTVKITMPRRVSKEQREIWEQLKEAESKKSSWWKR